MRRSGVSFHPLRDAPELSKAETVASLKPKVALDPARELAVHPELTMTLF